MAIAIADGPEFLRIIRGIGDGAATTRRCCFRVVTIDEIVPSSPRRGHLNQENTSDYSDYSVVHA